VHSLLNAVQRYEELLKRQIFFANIVCVLSLIRNFAKESTRVFDLYGLTQEERETVMKN